MPTFRISAVPVCFQLLYPTRKEPRNISRASSNVVWAFGIPCSRPCLASKPVRSGLLAVASRSSIFLEAQSSRPLDRISPHCHLELQGLLGFEPQLLSYRLAVKVCVLRTDLIALNLSEGSPRIGDRPTGRRGAVHKRTGVGTV
jgi:hypothetical protein